jgi:cysteine-rich repeat protein
MASMSPAGPARLHSLACVLLFGVAPALLHAGGLPRIHAAGFEAFGCQDGVVQEAEQCDDGDADDLDGCTSLCRRAAPCDATTRPGGDRFAVPPASGTCYVLVEAEATSWEAANTACLAFGGHLASLTGATETQAILPLLTGGARPWIGADDELAEGSFGWLTGEPFGPPNFADGQPDGDGDCLHVVDAAGAWADADCNLVGPVDARLCEVEPP